jgi:hypothetical protein
MAPISHWTTVGFCNGCPGGAARSMSQGLRVLVLGHAGASQFGFSPYRFALSLTVFCEYRHAASRRGFRRPTSSKVLQRKKPRIRSGAQD